MTDWGSQISDLRFEILDRAAGNSGQEGGGVMSGVRGSGCPPLHPSCLTLLHAVDLTLDDCWAIVRPERGDVRQSGAVPA